MGYCIEQSMWRHIFAVPTAVVDDHIKMASAFSLKVLLLILRSEKELSVSEISEKLFIDECDVKDALNFWINLKVIYNNTSIPNKNSDEPQWLFVDSDGNSKKNEVEKKNEVRTISSARVKLSTAEIDMIASENSKIKNLIQESQNILCKTLNPFEIEAIVSINVYYGIDVDLVLMLLSFCSYIGHSNMNYIERTARIWCEIGIDSYDKAEEYISTYSYRNGNEKLVRSALGIYDRNFTSKEKKFIETWFVDFSFDISMIKLSAERTINSINKISFPYMNRILSDWRKKGYTTTEQAANDEKVPERSYHVEESGGLVAYESI